MITLLVKQSALRNVDNPSIQDIQYSPKYARYVDVVLAETSQGIKILKNRHVGNEGAYLNTFDVLGTFASGFGTIVTLSAGPKLAYQMPEDLDDLEIINSIEYVTVMAVDYYNGLAAEMIGG